MMQCPALAVAEDFGKFDDSSLARGEKLLAGELRRGAQIEPLRRAVRRRDCGGESVQMRFVAGRDLQGAGLHLDEAVSGKPGPQGRYDPAARQKEGPAIGVDMGCPDGRSGWSAFRHVLLGKC